MAGGAAAPSGSVDGDAGSDDAEEGAPNRSVPRRGPLVVVAACALLATVVVPLLLRSGGPGRPADAGAEATPAASPTSPYAPPVAVAADSEYVEAVVADDDLLVTHWISLTSAADRLRLRVPSSPVLTDVDVDVEDLVVAADGARVDATGMRPDGPAEIPAARQVYVRYRLAGALERTGSVTDRALATVTALGVGLGGRELSRRLVFPGARVMSVACLGQGARAVPQTCGTDEAALWSVTSPAGEVPVTVIAQFDLAVVR